TVSAWTNTGSGYAQLLSAADTTYEGGKAGVEGSGNITRLKPFKAGVLNFPKAITEPASGVKGASATLNATVDPEAEATTYQFEYGPTTAYGSKAPASAPAAAGSGIGGVAVNETIGGLTQSTTYHYRVVAVSSAGTSYGEDRTLTTLNAPKATTGSASAVKATTATVEGALDPQGSATTYQFEWGPTTSYGSSAPTSPVSAGAGTGSVPVNQALTGLSEGTGYHYRLVAVNDGGTTYGEDKALTTLKLPKATTNAASAVKATTATLNASVNPEGSATTYQFEYGPTTTYGSKAPVSPASAGTGTVSISVGEAIGGLSQGTIYHYRVVATSPAGTTYGSDRTLTTLKVPKATTGSASAVKATTAVLGASINPEGGFATYQFEYGPTTSYGSKVPASAGFAGFGSSFVEVSQIATNLSPGATYHYRVVATTEAGTVYGEDKTFAAASFEAGAQLSNLPVVEPFDGSGTSVANFGSGWAALGWAGGVTPKGADEASGWRPVDAYSTVNGAYYNQTLNDSGWGIGTAATLANNPEIEARYFSLWLDMPSPTATTRAGYELRFTNTAPNLYTVTLSRWVSGTQTVLASKSGSAFVNGNSFALVDMGGTVAAWTNTGAGYAQLLSAADTTYESGKAGVEGSGNITRVNSFRASPLKLLPKAITEAATNVKMGQATLNASVNPQGTSTTYQIEYGASVSYGSKTPASPAAVGSGSSPVGVAQTVTTLEAGTTYHYRVVATSEAGVTLGEDRTATTPASPSYLSSFGTAGTGNGQFAHPAGIAIDGTGNVWVVDENNARVEKFGPGGEYLTKFGSTGSGDGQFNRPTDIAIDPKGNLWVTDASNNRVQKFGPGGEFLAKFGSSGSGNGQFSNPESLAVDSKGNVWVADTYNGRVQKFSETGEFLKAIGSSGTGSGQMVEATGIDIGLGGTVWVADWGNQKVLEFSETGEFIRQFGSEGTGNGQFKRPDVIEVDSKGRVWVGDQNNSRIQRFTESGTYMAQFGTAGSGAGQFSFGWPMGIASDGNGNLWIADTGNNRVQKWG
ncbi:MAG TPA: hypothetical protein VEP91_09245, partial [Solirubrobacterales bacterium]|nr:hypothetical protein [Solirubrobacterales bacterium]